MKRYLSYIFSMSLILLTSGCATIFGNDVKTVMVNSHPENALVYANHRYVGMTPFMLGVRNMWCPTLLTFKKTGYHDCHVKVRTAFQCVGKYNVLFPPGFVIDAATNNMNTVACSSRAIDVYLSRR